MTVRLMGPVPPSLLFDNLPPFQGAPLRGTCAGPREGPDACSRMDRKKPGNDLLSHSAAQAVPSARAGLTAVFGMGTGVAPPLESPGFLIVLSAGGHVPTGHVPFFCLDKLYGQASRSISTG
jgi:hypothetical protein